MLLFLFSFFSSADFIITTSPGDQLYPDVCWDGEAFWVIWQDDELGTIRGVRVNEEGQLVGEEVELLEKGYDPGPVKFPSVASGPDRIAVEARVLAGVNEFGTELWGIMHQEYSFSGEPLLDPVRRIPKSWSPYSVTVPQVLFGKEHFYTFHTSGKETPVDVHIWNVAVGYPEGITYLHNAWASSEIGFEFYPPAACWNGDSFLVFFFDEYEMEFWGAFFPDTFAEEKIGGDFSFERIFYPNSSTPIDYQTLVPGGSRYFWGSEAEHGKMGFDILDSAGLPVSDSTTVFDFTPEIKGFDPEGIFDGNNFICVWENRHNNGGIDLYSIEVDTLGNVLDSGYIVEGADTAQHPAMSRGPFNILMVWADNCHGNFNIYGMFLDAEGIGEKPEPAQPLNEISVDRTVFSDVLEITLSPAAEGGTVVICDAGGRVVRELPVSGRACVWDGRDDDGSLVGSGAYFISIIGANTNRPIKVIKLW